MTLRDVVKDTFKMAVDVVWVYVVVMLLIIFVVSYMSTHHFKRSQAQEQMCKDSQREGATEIDLEKMGCKP